MSFSVEKPVQKACAMCGYSCTIFQRELGEAERTGGGEAGGGQET